MSDPLAQLAYQTLQQGKSTFGILHKALSSQVRDWVAPPLEKQQSQSIPAETLQDMRQRHQQLLDLDWQEAEAGVYPVSLLFDDPWEDFWRYYPLICLDLPGIWQRINQKQYQVFDSEVETRGYPSYYLQNFHHQTNGYLSDLSANFYDIQVELLFNGSADPMRRRILAPLKQGLQAFAKFPTHQLKILDVACGTGRTLKSLRAALPQASLHGTDLSPTYLRKANALLSQDPGGLPQLLQSNAEQLPYADDYFHGVVSVFLFHELPPSARQNVINECYRVTQPGGTLIICDSIQGSDAPEFAAFMENFPVTFHEPYYRSYLEDDLVERLQRAGFTMIQNQVHFFSKYLIAQKPEQMPEQ